MSVLLDDDASCKYVLFWIHGFLSRLVLQEKLKENDAQIEELKALASQKQDAVAQLEQALQNCRAELNEKEKRVSDLLQVEVMALILLVWSNNGRLLSLHCNI